MLASRGRRPSDGPVDADQGCQRAPPVLFHVSALVATELWRRSQERRLVAHVALVEGWAGWHPGAREAIDVPRVGLGDDAAARAWPVSACEVWSSLVELQVQRPPRRHSTLDDLHRLALQDAGDEVAVALAEMDRSAVVREEVVVVMARPAEQRLPVIPAGPDLGRIGDRLGVAVHELSDMSGPVSRPLEPDRQDVSLVDQCPRTRRCWRSLRDCGRTGR